MVLYTETSLSNPDLSHKKILPEFGNNAGLFLVVDDIRKFEFKKFGIGTEGFGDEKQLPLVVGMLSHRSYKRNGILLRFGISPVFDQLIEGFGLDVFAYTH